jgi:general secretion pathway protein G
MKLIRHTRRASTAGFTLLEIMMVVLIIGLLLGFAITRMQGNVDTAKAVRVQGDITSLRSCILSYEIKKKVPLKEGGLAALVTLGIMDSVPKDPWGNDYVYERPGRHNVKSYDLYSPGENGIPGDADDIGNWEDAK